MYKWLPRKYRKIDPEVVASLQRHASIALLAIIAGLTAILFWRLAALRMDFYNNLWAPAYLLVHRQNPYDTAILHPALPALWFPMAVGFFSPLGLLSETIATKVWFVITVAELFATLLLILHDRLKLQEVAIIGPLVFLFPPLLNHFALGQFSITILLCLLLSAYFAGKRRDWLAAAFLALGLAKPQLAILALPGLGLYYFQLGGLKTLSRFGMQTALMSFLLSLPLFIWHPYWIPAWVESLHSNFTWLHPSLFSVLKQAIGQWGYLLWGMLGVTGLFICHQLWKNLPPLEAMSWSLGLTTIITPYIWSWDFILLLPAWALTFSYVGWKGKIFLLMTYWIGWLGFAFVHRLAGSSNDMFWWFPLWFLLGTALVALMKTRRHNLITLDRLPGPRL